MYYNYKVSLKVFSEKEWIMKIKLSIMITFILQSLLSFSSNSNNKISSISENGQGNKGRLCIGEMNIYLTKIV